MIAADESSRARVICRAFGANLVNDNLRGTLHARISDLIVLARTDGAVMVRTTEGVNAASACLTARILTLALNARLVKRTMLVDTATEYAPRANAVLFQSAVIVRVTLNLYFLAVNTRIALVVLWAPAVGAVSQSLAAGVDTACAGNARILTNALTALKEEIAIAVRTASNDTAGAFAYLASVTVVIRGAKFGRGALSSQAYEARLAFFADATIL